LVLRALLVTDGAAIARAANDLEIARWLVRMPNPYTPDDAEIFLRANLGNAGTVWVIEAQGNFVGIIATKGEFGYWLARTAWGQGYATEAGRAVLSRAFARHDRLHIDAGHLAGNARSRRVLDKLGFHQTGEDQRFVPALGRECDHLTMRLTRASWQFMASAAVSD
jgi:RimJ/RimL family protein N-acetyltransferase